MRNWGLRNYVRLAIDLAWVASTPILAVLIRDNFTPFIPRLQAIVPYALASVATGAIAFPVARLNRTLWRYTSLADVLHIVAAVTIVLLVALTVTFHINRLENVSRSLVVIQWFLLVGAMIGTRIAIRVWGGRSKRKASRVLTAKVHVLVIGVNDLTELYLRSVLQYGRNEISIVGILARESELHGRFLRSFKIFGPPEKIREVIAQLAVHGVTIDRVVVAEPFEKLSRYVQKDLLALEQESAIQVEWLLQSLGLHSRDAPNQQIGEQVASTPKEGSSFLVEQTDPVPRRYNAFKRVTDCISAIFLLLVLSPLIAAVVLLVIIDVGFPLVFWQQRPGRFGQPFKLFKFRTMRSAHDAVGNLIPDELRSSGIGRFLRRSGLDELPQLYNVLVGEMSLIGPRPLLPIDQPERQTARLLVRPGLTGWAQVNGRHEIAPEEKATLDVWYISNASFWLDIKIMVRTVGMLASGLRGARQSCGETTWAVGRGSSDTCAVEGGQSHNPPHSGSARCARRAA